ncbi:MAG: hypothetical protein HC884_08480 [Chloroflexaceae bacterium]|nr:hypothetical protein [Chloroflexaceae bacterium]
MVSLAEVPRSLEQVYLHIVREQDGTDHRTLEEEVAEWREGKTSPVKAHAHGTETGPGPGPVHTPASNRKEVAS